MSWLLWRARRQLARTGRQLARTGRQLARAACLSSIVLSPLAGLTLAQAQGPLDGTFQIDAAYVVLDHDVLELNSRVHYPDNEQIRRALQDGITLAFDVEVVIERPRRFWFNATLLDTTLRRELTYHAVTGRYVVRNEAGVSQQSFATLDEALEQLGDIEDLPILVQSQLGPGPWQVAVRAGVRRGRMPAALRALMFWNDDWHRLSGWYTWMLTL